MVHHPVEQKEEKTNRKVSPCQHCRFDNISSYFLTLTLFSLFSISRMGLRRSNRVPAKKGLKKVLFPSQPPPANRPPPAKKMVSKKLPLKDISNKVFTAVRAIATPADLRSPKAPIVNPYARKKGPSMVDSKPAAVALVAPANKASSETEVHQTVEPAILAPVVALASTVSSNTANTLEGIVNGVSTRGQILSDKETLAFAHSVVYKKTIGNISTDVDGKVLVEPFKSTTNPFGENINDLHAWASYVIIIKMIYLARRPPI